MSAALDLHLDLHISKTRFLERISLEESRSMPRQAEKLLAGFGIFLEDA